MLAAARAIEGALGVIARVTAWATLMPIAVMTLLQVVGRWVDIGATGELPQVSVVLVYAAAMLLFGQAYIDDAHVRVDVFQRHWSARRRAWVEIAGCAVALFPLCAVLTWYCGLGIALMPQGAEATAWISRLAAVLGPVLLGLAGVAVVLRNLVVLLSPPAAADR